MDVRSNRNVVYVCRYHVVWCSKYRRAVLVGDIASRLVELVGEDIASLDGELVEVSVQPDHVHLLVGVDPQFGIHRLVKQIKGRSSRVLRDEHPSLKSRLPSLWTNSYFVATAGGAPLATIQRYIEQQGR
ncbi:MAG: IS200/IS605 family transposase [Solirubrobacteraceae bacterium]